jgi:hypothetical protein
MSRRGSRGRRQARRHKQDQRERDLERWAKWRVRQDRINQEREAEALRVELESLARRPGWRVNV